MLVNSLSTVDKQFARKLAHKYVGLDKQNFSA